MKFALTEPIGAIRNEFSAKIELIGVSPTIRFSANRTNWVLHKTELVKTEAISVIDTVLAGYYNCG